MTAALRSLGLGLALLASPAVACAMDEGTFRRWMRQSDHNVAGETIVLTRPVRFTGRRVAVISTRILYLGPPAVCVLTLDAPHQVLAANWINGGGADQAVCVTDRGREGTVSSTLFLNFGTEVPHTADLWLQGNAAWHCDGTFKRLPDRKPTQEE